MAEESNPQVFYVELEKGLTSPAMQQVPLTEGVTSPQMTAIPETAPTSNLTPTTSIASSVPSGSGTDSKKD